MTHAARWTCRGCGALLGRVRDGVLWPLAAVESVDGRGVARLRCPWCAAVRDWFPAAAFAALGQARPPDRLG